MSVSAPVISHTTKSHPGEPTCRAMSADTIKIPEPIMDPATIIVESKRPSPRTNLASSVVTFVASSAIGSLYQRRDRFPSDYAKLRAPFQEQLTRPGRRYVGSLLRVCVGRLRPGGLPPARVAAAVGEVNNRTHHQPADE